MHRLIRRSIFLVMLALGGPALACTVNYTVHLQTFGEGVLVELRMGVPGASRVARAERSAGGTVVFSGLCPGNYFLAIGNEDSVSVGPIRAFENDYAYTSRITLQKGSGNLANRSRKSL